MTTPFRYTNYGQPIIGKRQMNEALDYFADLLSLDIPLPAIAEQMEISEGTACVLLRNLCERLGVQTR